MGPLGCVDPPLHVYPQTGPTLLEPGYRTKNGNASAVRAMVRSAEARIRPAVALRARSSRVTLIDRVKHRIVNSVREFDCGLYL